VPLLKIGRALILLFLCVASLRAEEPQSAKIAFQSYISALETRLDAQNGSGSSFLWIDQDAQRHDAARKGEIPVRHINTPSVSGGTLEHWIGGTFIPNATPAQVLKVDQDYARYSAYYAPEIVQSRLLSHEGNHFQVFYRLKKHKIVTVVLDTTHGIDFVPLGSDKYFVRSHSEQIHEVKNPGEADEKVLREGEGLGFLWSMNSYWRVEQRDGGVYVECEVVTLARSIPLGMGALLRSTIESFASDSLTNTLRAKKQAVLATH
jgi:CRISPR-associated DxTHG motif protein